MLEEERGCQPRRHNKKKISILRYNKCATLTPSLATHLLFAPAILIAQEAKHPFLQLKDLLVINFCLAKNHDWPLELPLFIYIDINPKLCAKSAVFKIEYSLTADLFLLFFQVWGWFSGCMVVLWYIWVRRWDRCNQCWLRWIFFVQILRPIVCIPINLRISICLVLVLHLCQVCVKRSSSGTEVLGTLESFIQHFRYLDM